MTTIDAVLDDLGLAARLWEDQAGELAAVGGSLAAVDVGLLGPRVAPAVRGFLDGWEDDVTALASRASVNADAFADFLANLGHVDEATAARLAGLMPYDASEAGS